MTVPVLMVSKGIYNLTRNKGENSIEHNLFKALAAQFPSGTPLSMTHISRASTTHQGEHATKQVISFNLGNEVELPSAAALNKSLPDSIRVFNLIKVGSDFSARRTCEARTIEYVIPTYAFSHPPEVTEYCNQEEDVYSVMPIEGPKGGLFKTMKRGQSLARRATFMRKGNETDYYETDAADDKELVEVEQSPKLKKKFSLWKAFSSMFKSSNASGSERLKESLNATMTRGTKQAVADSENFSATLGRSMNRKRNLEDVLAQDINERQMNDSPEMLFEPLSIPAPNAEELQNIRHFRLPESVYKRIVHSLALFNGTHNFHNYIPGSVQDDNRCFVRVFNIEASPLEIHHGMEWVRIKVQGRSFGRDQIKRMMAMLIMVIRTNTPRSVIGNSFGYQKIDIPEAPNGFLILDQPHYNNYNADCAVKNAPLISFGDVSGVKEFSDKIHEAIFEKEFNEMYFEEWLREIDNYSFMYTHYLNERGLITPQRNQPKDVYQ